MPDIIQKTTQAQISPKAKNLKELIGTSAMKDEVKKALPSVITPERFIRIATSALSRNPQLMECTQRSFLGAMMTAAQLGLEPNTPLGHAYLLPYKNNKLGVTECQFQIGYKGLIDLAYRSGQVQTIMAQTVYEHDEFDYELGLNPILKHKPAKSDRGEPVSFYAVVKLKDGGECFGVMSIDDIRKHAQKYSQSYGSSSSPWKTAFEEMAKKTVLKSALKYAPLKTDFTRQLTTDESIKVSVSDDMTLEDNVIDYAPETEVENTEKVEDLNKNNKGELK